MTWSTSAAIDVTKMTNKDLDKQERHIAKMVERETDPVRLAQMTAWKDRLAAEAIDRERPARKNPPPKQRELTTPMDLAEV